MPEWFETFFSGLYNEVLGNTFDDRRSMEQAGLVKRLLRLRKGQSVLDIPCGMGRLSLPLARMGVEATGVDLTPLYVKRARRFAREAGVNARFLRGDMRGIAFDGEFDAAFNWFGSFGYFTDRQNLDFTRRVFHALKPGGRFLVEGPNRSWILSHFRERSDDMIHGVRIIQRRRLDTRTGRIRARYILSKGKRTQTNVVDMKMYNGADIRRLLRAAGFRNVQLHGSPPLGRFTRHSRRLIAVGQRPN